MRLDQLTRSEWREALPEDGVEVFHTPEALAVLADHAPGKLRLYGGFKGEEPVALLPVFVRKRSMGRALFSPPPSAGVPHLGPVLMPNSPKRRKHEQLNRRFTRAVLEELGVDSSLSLLRMVCSTAYADPRPYEWEDLDVETAFTYHLDVDGQPLESIRSGLSKSLRREIRSLEEELTVSVEGLEAARRIYEDQRERYDEQEESFPLSWEYVRDLVASLEDRSRVYVARDDTGSYRSGIVVLYSGTKAYFWHGGTKAYYDNCSVNSLLHWSIVEDIATDPELDAVGTYDLMGANTERLCEYKAKFGARLVPYYIVESGGARMDIAKTAYRVVSG